VGKHPATATISAQNNNFKFVVNGADSKTCTVENAYEITPQSVKLTLSGTKTYDGNKVFTYGTNLSVTSATYLNGINKDKVVTGEDLSKLLTAMSFNVTKATAVSADVNTVDNTIEIECTIDSNYKVDACTATATINPRKVIVTLSDSKQYDGSPFSETIEIETDLGHTLSVEVTTTGSDVQWDAVNKKALPYVYNTTNPSNQITNGFEITNLEFNCDIANYEIIYDLSATITPFEIKLFYGTVTKDYDGTNQKTVNSGEAISYWIRSVDENGNPIWDPVNNNELNDKIPGWGTVEHKPFKLEFANSTITGADPDTGELINVNTYQGTGEGADTALVSKYTSEFSSNYAVTIGVKTLVINPRKVTVTLSDSKPYDGSPFIKDLTKLVDGHELSVKVTTTGSDVQWDAVNKKALPYVYNTTDPSNQIKNGFEITNLEFNGDIANYEIIYDLSATINQQKVKIQLKNQWSYYGEDIIDRLDHDAYVIIDNSIDKTTLAIELEVEGLSSSSNAYKYEEKISVKSANSNYEINVDRPARSDDKPDQYYGDYEIVKAEINFKGSENASATGILIAGFDYKGGKIELSAKTIESNLMLTAYFAGDHKKAGDQIDAPAEIYDGKVVATVDIGGTYKYTLKLINETNYGFIEESDAIVYVKAKSVAVGVSLYTFEDALAKKANMVVKADTQTAEGDAKDLYKGGKYYTIVKTATLDLPYSNSGSNWLTDEASTNASHADSDSKNKYVELKLLDDFVLTNAGTINIGGQLGASGAPSGSHANGHTAGLYAQITMCKGSQINSTGTIQCYGYIKQEESLAQSKKESDWASVTIESGEIYAPFVVYDFRGGAVTGGVFYNAKPSMSSLITASRNKTYVAPFTMFDVPNVHSLLTIKNAGIMIGLADLFASDQHNTTKIKLVGAGREHMIALDANDPLSKVTFKYYPDSANNIVDHIASVDADKEALCGYTDISLYGKVTTSSLSMPIKLAFKGYNLGTMDISMDGIYFPLSWKQRINIYGTLETNTMFKLLPGSKVTVHTGGTLITTNSIVVYDLETKALCDCGSCQESHYIDKMNGAMYPTNVGDAKFVLDGTLNIAGGSFGGKIISSEGNFGAKIIVGDVQVSSVGSQEAHAVYESFVNYETFEFDAKCRLEESTEYTGLGTKTIYYGDGKGSFFKDGTKETYTITYIVGGETYFEQIVTANDLVPNPNVSINGYVVDKDNYIVWYTDENCTSTYAFNNKPTKNVTLYAKMQEFDLTYNVVVTKLDANGNLAKETHQKQQGVEGEFDNYISIAGGYQDSKFTIADMADENFGIATATAKEGYVFLGWYSDEDCSYPISSIDGFGTFNLYAKVMAENCTFTINFADGHDDVQEEFEPVYVGFDDEPDLSDATSVIDEYSSNISFSKYFVGWFDDDSGTKFESLQQWREANKNGNQLMQTGSITLRAQWSNKEFILKYDNGEYFYHTDNDKFQLPDLDISDATVIWTKTAVLSNSGLEAEATETLDGFYFAGRTMCSKARLLGEYTNCTLYGESWFIADSISVTDKDNDGKYDYDGEHANVMLYGLDLNKIKVDMDPDLEDQEKEDVKAVGTFINKSIQKLFIDGSCYTANPNAQIEGLSKNDNYIKQGACGGSDTQMYKIKYAGAFSNNPELKEDEVIYGVNGDGNSVTRKMLGDHAFANTKDSADNDSDPIEGFGSLISDFISGGPGDGFWFILLPAFALLLAGGYLSLKGNKKQTN
ncbi:MAG: InlB B-repeat-containing protein, partial [Clostridia bacterium]|nr:InlB B-repeat-containing protein [Clostridia bacterium]